MVTRRVKKNELFDPTVAREKLRDYLESGITPDVDTEDYALYEQYVNYIALSNASKTEIKPTEPTIVRRQQSGQDIGNLQRSDTDYMFVHTKEAYRLLKGREINANEVTDGARYFVPGGFHCSSQLRKMWLKSIAGNPYADWALVVLEQKIDLIQKNIANETNKLLKALDDQRNKGLFISVLRSSKPLKVELGFNSPYGFLVMQVMTDFDYFVRLVKSLQQRNLISYDEARLLMKKIATVIRAIFDISGRYDKTLSKEVFSSITREDFFSSKASKKKALKEIENIWPGMPVEILEGAMLPRHARAVDKGRLLELKTKNLGSDNEDDDSEHENEVLL